MNIVVTKKRLTKYANGRTRINDEVFALKGSRTIFCKGKYEVLVDGHQRVTGGFFHVLDQLISDSDKAKMLYWMGMALDDPALKEKSMIRHFSNVQLYCLAALMDEPKSIKEIVQLTGINENIVYRAIAEFQTVELIPVVPKEEETDDSGNPRHGLSKKGKAFMKKLKKDPIFKEFKKNLENVDLTDLPYLY